MINSALEFLSTEINNQLNLRNGNSDQVVIPTNVATEDGKWAIPVNTIGLSLINIEEDKTIKEPRTTSVNSKGLTESKMNKIMVNLYVLITANFTNFSDPNHTGTHYLEGLKQLSYVMSFLQAKQVFTKENSPGMAVVDPNLEKLVVDLYSYSFEQLYNFWTVVGAKYLPSVLYKVRLVTLGDSVITDINPAISQVTQNLRTSYGTDI